MPKVALRKEGWSLHYGAWYFLNWIKDKQWNKVLGDHPNVIDELVVNNFYATSLVLKETYQMARVR